MYLIVIDDRTDARWAFAGYGAADANDYAKHRAALALAFPGSRLLSPLDAWETGAFKAVIYLSHSVKGVGRSGGQFHEWGIVPNANLSV